MYIVCENCGNVLMRDEEEPRFDDAVYIKPCECKLKEIHKDAIELAKKILNSLKIENKMKEKDVKIMLFDDELNHTNKTKKDNYDYSLLDAMIKHSA